VSMHNYKILFVTQYNRLFLKISYCKYRFKTTQMLLFATVLLHTIFILLHAQLIQGKKLLHQAGYKDAENDWTDSKHDG